MLDIADALEANEKMILTENEADVVAAKQDGYDTSLLARLALKPGKVWDFLIMLYCYMLFCFALFYRRGNPFSLWFSLYVFIDLKSCKLSSCACRDGRANWSYFKENRGK